MQQATITWTEGEQFRATGPSGHTLTLDGDRQRNSGPSPMELLIMGLGACRGIDVVIILKMKRQNLKRLEIRVGGERASDPPTVWMKLKVHFTLTGKDLDPKAVAHAIELSRTKYCSVAATLSKTAEIEWSHSIEPV